MITTAIDTNILLDVFLPNPKFVARSVKILQKAYNEGRLIISEIVFAELSPQFPKQSLLESTLDELGIEVVPIDEDVAWLAGKRWAAYREKGGKRERIISDFLIGAHALLNADRLLTRDRGFYKTYFPELKIM